MLFFERFLRGNTFTITEDHPEFPDTTKADLTRARDLTLLLAKPGLQYVILCDASFHGTRLVLRIEDFSIDQTGKAKKTYNPVSFSSRLFTTTQLKFFLFYKEFLALYFASDQFTHLIWGTTKPTLSFI